MSINLKALPEGWSTLFLRQTLTYGRKEGVFVERMVERWPLYALDLKTNVAAEGMISVASIQLERAEVLYDTTYIGRGPKGEEVLGLCLGPIDARKLSGKSLARATEDHPAGREFGIGYRTLNPSCRARVVATYSGLIPPGKEDGEEFEFVLAISGPRDKPLAPYTPAVGAPAVGAPAVSASGAKHDPVTVGTPIAQVAFPSKSQHTAAGAHTAGAK